MSIPVNVYNEWDPLEEIIVGDPLYANVPEHDEGFTTIQLRADGGTKASLPKGQYAQHIVEETEEDIQKFIVELERLNITVRRPKPIHCEAGFKTLDWEVENYFTYCPRDILLAIGNTIIETPSVFRSRYFESFAYKSILTDYLKKGARWIAAPKPRLLTESYSTDLSQLAINEDDPVFDAANILRAGRDIFYLVSDSGNELGLQWLQSTLGSEYRVHPCRNLYSSLHIDTTLVFLRPGLLLANPSRVNDDNLPELLKEWDIIYAPEMVEFSTVSYTMSSSWIGMNLLMINPNLAVVSAHQKQLIKLLESKKIDVIPLTLRHSRALGGSFHCITLDVRRKGQLESYFNG